MTDPSSSITRCPQPGMPSPGCPAAGAGTTVARARAARATVPPSRYPPGGRPVPGAARAYAEAKWAGLAPVSRRSVTEALVTVTIALSAREKAAPEPKMLRQALFAWAFNPATREQVPPRETALALALGWAARASLPVSALDDPATVRLALGACARTLAGKPAAGSTQRRKRSVFYNALGYAVEQGHLASNPVDRIQWTTPAVAQSVDRRVVVSPAQARKLLAAVRGLSDRGAHLEAFYACLYYAALRPSEAVMLRESDLYLPAKG